MTDALDALMAEYTKDNGPQPNAAVEPQQAGGDALDALIQQAQGSQPKQPQAATRQQQQPMSENDKFYNQIMGNLSDQQNTPSTFMDAVEGFNRSFGRVSEGTVQLVAKGLGLTGLEATQKKVHDAAEQSNAQAAQRSPIANMLGGIVGDVGLGVYATAAGMGLGSIPGVAKGVGAVSGYSPAASLGVTAASGGVAGAAIGGLNYADTLDERIKNMAYGGAIGAAVPVGFQAIKSLTGMTPVGDIISKYFRGKSVAINDLAKQAAAQGETAETITAKVANANSLKVPVTPGEALGGPIRAAEAKVPLSENYRPDVNAVLQAKELGVKGQLQGTIDSVAGPNNADEVTKLFSSFKETKIPADKLSPLLQNPSISSRLKGMQGNVDSVAKDLPDDSFIKLNEIKKQMDKELFADTYHSPEKPMSPDTKFGIKNAIGQIKDTLQEVDPNYNVANKLAQQGIIKDEFNGLYSKLKLKAGTEQSPDVKDIYNTFFGNAEKQDTFLSKLAQTANTPEEATALTDNAKKLMDVMSKVQDSPLRRILNKGIEANPKGINVYQAIEKGALGEQYKDTVLDLMLHQDKWAPAISKILAKGTPSKELTEFMRQITPMMQGIQKGVVASEVLVPPVKGYLGGDNSNISPINSKKRVDALGIQG